MDPISGKSKSAKVILSDSSEFLSANLLIPDTADIGLTNQVRPTKRLLRDLPCYISPSSGIVPAGIAITLQLQLDLRGILRKSLHWAPEMVTVKASLPHIPWPATSR